MKTQEIARRAWALLLLTGFSGLATVDVALAQEAGPKAVYTYVQQEPQLPGKPGIAAIVAAAQAKLVVPPQAARGTITGRVFTRVTTAPDGTVSDVEVTLHNMTAACSACDSAAIRAVRSLPRLIPAKQNGRAVYFSFPILLVFPPQASPGK